MKQFEKNIQDKLRDAHSSEGVNADQLWHNIESELHGGGADLSDISLTEQLSQQIIGNFQWILPVIGFTVVLSSVWIYNHYEDNATLNAQKDQTEYFITKKENEGYSTDKTATNLQTKTSGNVIENSTPINSSFIVENADKPEHKKVSDLLVEKVDTRIEKTQEVTKILSEEVIVEQGDSSFGRDEKLAVPITSLSTQNQNSYLPAQSLEEGEKSVVSGNVLILSTQSLKSINPFKSSDKPSADLIIKNTIDPIGDLNKGKKLSLGIFVGTHTNFNLFENGTIGQSLSQSFHNRPGGSVAVEAAYDLNRIFSVKAGLEYSFSVEAFNHQYSWDTLVPNNNIPGEMMTATATRMIQQHNKHTVLSLPVMLGVKKKSILYEYGVYTGIGFNYSLSQSGTTLNNAGEIIRYPSIETNVLPKPEFYLSYHLQPYFTYHINKQISWQFRANAHIDNYVKNKFYNIKYNSIKLGGSIGIVYDL